MTTTPSNQKQLRQRKFLLMLPVLAFPFITMMFWALGGGTAAKAETMQNQNNGFNMRLPDALLKDDRSLTKMSYYEQIARDSAKLRELIKNDPYHQQDDSAITLHPFLFRASDTLSNPSVEFDKEKIDRHSSYAKDPNEEKVYQKLRELNAAINKASTPSYPPVSNDDGLTANTDIAGMEQIMRRVDNKKEVDPEMQQLDGMLDKILTIQHSENNEVPKNSSTVQSNRQVFAATTINDDPVSLLTTSNNASREVNTGSSKNGFYSLDNDNTEQGGANTISACIAESQTLVNGATVKLRITSDVIINGQTLSKNSFVYGIASLSGERLTITVNSVRLATNIYPVKWQVYDLDGLAGIYIPGAITRDVAKQSVDRAVQSIGMSSLDPSIGAQAASAGIEAVRSLASKKAKLIKVSVKEGYEVLLVDEDQKQ